MNEMEIRALNEHTNALEEHTRALNRMASLLEQVMSTSDGGVASLVLMMSSMQETAWQLHSDVANFTDAAQTVHNAAQIADGAAGAMIEAANRMNY